MDLRFSRVGLVGRYHRGELNNPVGDAVRDIALWLQARGLQVFLDTDTAVHCPVPDAQVRTLRELGFRFVTLDLEGFRTGSMNELIPLETRRKYESQP